MDELRTRRLLLRRWRDEDLEPFAALNAHPEVMRHFPTTLSREESDAVVARVEADFERHGFGWWAVEVEGCFVGFTGLSVPAFDAPFLPSVEVGWRFARSVWGRGYATEAATAALDAAFGPLGLAEVVSFTTTTNTRSERVMHRLGMSRVGGFDHPRLPEGSPLRPHVLYRAVATGWVRPPAAG